MWDEVEGGADHNAPRSGLVIGHFVLEEWESKGVFGVWNGFAFDGFGESVSVCKRSAQVDELGIVASEGEVGVEKEDAHE